MRSQLAVQLTFAAGAGAADFLTQTFVRGLPAERALRAVEIAEVLPLLELEREHLGVVDHDAIEHPVELLGIDVVRAFDFAVQARRRRLDSDVLDTAIEHVPVEAPSQLVVVGGLNARDVDVSSRT